MTKSPNIKTELVSHINITDFTCLTHPLHGTRHPSLEPFMVQRTPFSGDAHVNSIDIPKRLHNDP